MHCCDSVIICPPLKWVKKIFLLDLLVNISRNGTNDVEGSDSAYIVEVQYILEFFNLLPRVTERGNQQIYCLDNPFELNMK